MKRTRVAALGVLLCGNARPIGVLSGSGFNAAAHRTWTCTARVSETLSVPVAAHHQGIKFTCSLLACGNVAARFFVVRGLWAIKFHTVSPKSTRVTIPVSTPTRIAVFTLLMPRNAVTFLAATFNRTADEGVHLLETWGSAVPHLSSPLCCPLLHALDGQSGNALTPSFSMAVRIHLRVKMGGRTLPPHSHPYSADDPPICTPFPPHPCIK